MQLGGIEREHTRSSHQVTNCMHEHTSYQKTGAAHAAASGMTEKLEQKAAETTESTEVAQVEKEAENETAETGAEANALHFDPEDGMLWPMEGNVILNYSMDSTIYFATLDQYKYLSLIHI